MVRKDKGNDMLQRLKNVITILVLFTVIGAAIFLIPGTFTEAGDITSRGIGVVVAGTLIFILPRMTPIGGKKVG